MTFAPEGVWERLPPIRTNWSLRASLRARRRLTASISDLDALLIHTQTAAFFSVGPMRRVPTVISVDATPINWDSGRRGAWPRTRQPCGYPEAKRRVVRRAYRGAAAVIAWSDWARASLLDDYGLDPERVVKIPGGVEVPPQTPRNPHDGPVRLLFVAFDFEAKGGSELLAALEGLKGWELDVVTHSPVEADGRLRVHRGVIPRSPELADLYSHADAVVLPSRGDASPFVVLESMAASLPIITTRFGAIGEIDAEGTGLLVPPRDVGALSAALQRILTDSELRKRLGEAVRARVISRYRADRNGNRMLDVLVAAALDTAHGSTVSPRRSTLPGRPIGETPMGQQAWRR